MKQMNKVDYDVVVPERTGRGRVRSEEYIIVKEFIKTDHKTMRITYETSMIAKKRRQSIDVTIKRESIPVRTQIAGNELFFIKSE